MTYTGIVVLKCAASAVSATRTFKKPSGPWLLLGPRLVLRGPEPPMVEVPRRAGVPG